MTTNPLAQLLLCAVLVFIVWILCGPLLRRLSKPKPLPSLEDIMRADIDHAEREAYRYEQSAHADKMMARMYQERVDGLITQLAERTGPQVIARSSDRIHVVTVGGGGGGGTTTGPTGYPEPDPAYFDPAFVRMRRKEIERAAGADLDVWGAKLGILRRLGQPSDLYRAELVDLFDARYPGAV